VDLGRYRRWARGDAWKKIIKYDINGDFSKIICLFIEKGDRECEVFCAARKKAGESSGIVESLFTVCSRPLIISSFLPINLAE
jgi:hypothetical protein